MYYIRCCRGGREAKVINEPVGRASSGMTAAKANRIRAARIEGKELCNTEKRKAQEEENAPVNQPWTVLMVWNAYSEHMKGRSIAKAAK